MLVSSPLELFTLVGVRGSPGRGVGRPIPVARSSPDAAGSPGVRVACSGTGVRSASVARTASKTRVERRPSSRAHSSAAARARIGSLANGNRSNASSATDW